MEKNIYRIYTNVWKIYFKNLRENRDYNRKNKLELTKHIIIDAMRNNVKDSLVFILSNNTAYFYRNSSVRRW